MALQEAWLRGLEWDEEFPDDLKLITHCYRQHEEAVEDV